MYGAPNYPKKAQGGPVEGPGTGTSDSIKKEVPAGSFIMPADSTARLGLNPEAIKRYKESLAAKDADPPQLGARKNVPVNLSNGEYELPPEQVHAVGVQALEQARDATHTPTGGRGFDREAFMEFKKGKEIMPRLGFNPQMAQQYKAQQGKQQFFADGGLVEDPDKLPRLGARRPKPGLVDGLAGGAKALAGAALVPQAAIVDGLRSGAARLAGGDPDTLEGGAGKYRDMATGLAKEGLDQAQGAAQQIQSAGREALGVKPLAKPAGQPAATTSAVTAPTVGGVPGYNGMPRPAAPELPRLGAPGWNKTGVGAGGAGGEIASRVGANGVPEFTNDAESVASAQELPRLGVGAAGLKVAGISNMADDVPLEQRGSINNVGNGVGGGISYGEAGDSKMAIERFDRANDIRAQTIAERPRELGDTGKVTGILDNSRAPTLAERQRAVVDQQQAQAEAVRAQTQQNASEVNQRIATDTQRMQTEQLNQQRLQQELASGQYSVQDRERIASLQARMVDPSLSEEERTSAREAYTALSTQAKDRYQSQDVILGRDESGKDVRGTQLIDVTTGRPVAGGQQAGALPAGVTRDSALAEARAAAASGVSRDAINERLMQWGLEPI